MDIYAYKWATISVDGGVPTLRAKSHGGIDQTSNVYTDVVVDKYPDCVYVYGKRRVFDWHCPGDMFGDDLTNRANKYCTLDTSWYTQEPSRFDALFGKQPQKTLDDGWYMRKDYVETLFVFRGTFVEKLES